MFTATGLPANLAGSNRADVTSSRTPGTAEKACSVAESISTSVSRPSRVTMPLSANTSSSSPGVSVTRIVGMPVLSTTRGSWISG